jgi:hypothetical protein
MDGLFDTLDDHAGDKNKHPTIRMAVKRGLTVLKKYYGKTDESSLFWIAMSAYLLQNIFELLICYQFIVLHPAYKTEYFCSHGWPKEWITSAIDLLRADWAKTYKPTAGSSGSTMESNNGAQNEDVQTFFPYINCAHAPSFTDLTERKILWYHHSTIILGS